MPYVGPDGRITERRSPWRWSIISDFFQGVYDFLALFLVAIINPPQLQGGARQTNYGQRQQGRPQSGPSGGRGSNIRGVKNLQGSTCARTGGG